jgi:hypothetical protein
MARDRVLWEYVIKIGFFKDFGSLGAIVQALVVWRASEKITVV